jgi:chromate transporter
MDDNILLRLLVVFAPLSLLSLGGGQAIVAEIHAQSVEINHWVTNQQFANLYAISRAAPGPSTLIAALIGWRAGGFPRRADHDARTLYSLVAACLRGRHMVGKPA